MVMFKECTDQMDKFNILRAPTISEDGLQPNSPARLSALLLEGTQLHSLQILIILYIVLPIDRFYIALFSALQHSPHSSCM